MLSLRYCRRIFQGLSKRSKRTKIRDFRESRNVSMDGKFFRFIDLMCFKRIGKGYIARERAKVSKKRNIGIRDTKRIVQIAIRYRGYLQPI